MLSKALILIAALAVSSFADTKVEILLSARDLKDQDICCSSPVYPPDVYAIVYYAPSSFDSYKEQGRTKILSDNNNPEWSDVFQFSLLAGGTPRIKIDLMDSDVDADDYIGFAEFNLYDLVNAFGQRIEKALIPIGEGYVTVKARVNGTLLGESAEENEMFNHPSQVIQVPVPTISEIPLGQYKYGRV